MNFTGTGLRLQPGDLARAAHQIADDDVAKIQAVLSVEARGRGFDDANRPTMLYEPHVFYRNLTGADRAAAVREGLAYERWLPGHYPRTAGERYLQLARAMQINKEAALKACSWGLGQVLGENHNEAGFWSAEAMVTAALESEGRQLDQLVAFVISKGLDKALRRGDWAAFARGYNGADYAKNAYDRKLASAYAKARACKPIEADPLADGILSIGDKGRAVMILQTELMAEGLLVKADGDFGKLTKQAVEVFQRRHGLTVDGVVVPVTAGRLGLDWGNKAAPAPLVDAPAAPSAAAPAGGILGLIIKIIAAIFRR